VKITQVKYTLLLAGATNQPELTFLLEILSFPFLFGNLEVEFITKYPMWMLQVESSPPPKRKEKKRKEGTKQMDFFCKWKFVGSKLSVGRFFIYFYGKKKSYGSDLEFIFWGKIIGLSIPVSRNYFFRKN
jgi:hypothetical protein